MLAIKSLGLSWASLWTGQDHRSQGWAEEAPRWPPETETEWLHGWVSRYFCFSLTPNIIISGSPLSLGNWRRCTRWSPWVATPWPLCWGYRVQRQASEEVLEKHFQSLRRWEDSVLPGPGVRAPLLQTHAPLRHGRDWRRPGLQKRLDRGQLHQGEDQERPVHHYLTQVK